jgi:small subunit ribosomal protein S2
MQKRNEVENNNSDLIEKMVEAGVQYGYSKSKRHPSVSSYIHATKNRVDIINLEKTATMVEEVSAHIKSLGAQMKTILFVGTKPEAKEAIKSIALALNMPYVNERWIGGTLSNFSEIKKRINELEKYQKELKTGELEKFTKKERVVLSKKMERLEKYYTGLLGLKKTPDVLFIIDPKKEHIAVAEAKTMNVPVIAVLNSDSNIKVIDYPIVGNDASVLAIKFFTTHMSAAYQSGTSINK